jgi:hypothetical protein
MNKIIRRASVIRMKTILTLGLAALVIGTAQADDHRDRDHRTHNYIIERQQAGLIEGVPTIRRIIGRREIDGYRDLRTGTTLWFEGNNLVGVEAR